MSTIHSEALHAAPHPSLSERIDRLGGKVVGLVLSLYGLAVVFEVIRAYVLI